MKKFILFAALTLAMIAASAANCNPMNYRVDDQTAVVVCPAEQVEYTYAEYQMPTCVMDVTVESGYTPVMPCPYVAMEALAVKYRYEFDTDNPLLLFGYSPSKCVGFNYTYLNRHPASVPGSKYNLRLSDKL